MAMYTFKNQLKERYSDIEYEEIIPNSSEEVVTSSYLITKSFDIKSGKLHTTKNVIARSPGVPRYIKISTSKRKTQGLERLKYTFIKFAFPQWLKR
jgi:hypothetical protein